MAERDYVLGTHDAEIERLGLQHKVWRPYALDAWRRARVTAGQTVVDFGVGPGFATVDIAEIVGPSGRVVALERSGRFIEALRAQADRLSLTNIEAVEIDLAQDPIGVTGADAAWARWIFAFLPQPEAAVARLSAVLRPGGVVVIHEYLDYATWRVSPRSALFETFVQEVMESWRATGGEPNVGLDVPRWLEACGMEILSTRLIAEVLTPRDFMWRWPMSFIDVNLDRLVDIGRIAAHDARALREELARLANLPGVRMSTPVLAEVIARRPV